MQTLTEQTPSRRSIWIFAGTWFLVNMLQAIFTELANDEAYYWMYARKLDFGYYDHPPMIALMIRAGGLLLHGELGVRLWVAFLSSLSIPVLFELCGRRDLRLFIFSFCAITVFQVYGFIAVPDSPLLFFTALFFLAYRNYTREDSIRNATLVAICIALLLYSKYHGLLVIFFTVLSNLKLFRRKSLYLIIAIVIAAYLPHILWQVNNDYPSWQYHILNKSQSAYSPADSLEFIGGTLMIAGPLVSLLLVYAFIRSRGGDAMLRAMRFTFIGFVLFFFASTFNSRIEANWMAASVVPLFVVGFGYISDHPTLRKWMIGLSLVSAIIFAFARINLISDVVPVAGSKAMPEFYGWKKWSAQVREHSHGLPVVILNSYQHASKYSFYNDTESVSLNTIAYRRNQYDIWDMIDHVQGKSIALVYNGFDGSGPVERFQTDHGEAEIQIVNNFHSFTKVRVATDKDWYTFPHSSDVEIPLTFLFADENKPVFGSDTSARVSLVYTRYYFTDYDGEYPIMNMDSLNIDNGWTTMAKIRTPEKPGPYYLRFSLKSGELSPYINSHLIRMDVE